MSDVSLELSLDLVEFLADDSETEMEMHTMAMCKVDAGLQACSYERVNDGEENTNGWDIDWWFKYKSGSGRKHITVSGSVWNTDYITFTKDD